MIALHVSYGFGLPNDGKTHMIATFVLAALACIGIYLVLCLLTSLPLKGTRSNLRWFKVWQLSMGVDGRPSSSKFQVVLWSIVVLFAYLVIFLAQTINGQITNGHRNLDIPIPQYLLALAGLSFATAGLAKIITQRGVDAGKLPLKVTTGNVADSTDTGVKGGLLTDDAGQTDIGKFQLISWTVVTAGIFLVNLYENVAQYFGVLSPRTLTLAFPAISTTLLAILGVNQGAYVATKLAPLQGGKAPAGNAEPQKTATQLNTAADSVNGPVVADAGSGSQTAVPADGAGAVAPDAAWQTIRTASTGTPVKVALTGTFSFDPSQTLKA